MVVDATEVGEQYHAPMAAESLNGLPIQMEGMTPERLEEVEGVLLQHDQVECPLNHFFGPGIYIREGFIPAGTLAIGHKHKYPHTNVLVRGTLRIIGPDGIPSTIHAPTMFVTGAGRKMAYAITDCVFQNIHATTETDLEKLEEQLIEKSETWLAHHEIEQAKLLMEE
jgi:hypothetical protein